VTLTPTVPATPRRTSRAPATYVWVVLVTITSVLVVDASASLAVQRLLGILTWAVLLLLLARESSVVRVQTLIVVVFATAVEYTFSPLLQVYVYRFDNVPMYVPPGHGLVYLAAWSVGRLAFVKANERVCTALVILAGGAWAAYGIDGDGDGKADIMSPYDAVPSAAGYLCRFGANRGPEGLYDAIFAYNHADWYVQKVLATARAYE